jgi:hypothetical protein
MCDQIFRLSPLPPPPLPTLPFKRIEYSQHCTGLFIGAIRCIGREEPSLGQSVSKFEF